MEKIKIVLNGGLTPQKKFVDSAGYDLFIPKNIKVKRGKQIIDLGIKVAVPKGYGMFIFARSGVQSKGVPGFDILGDDNTKKRRDCIVKLGLVDCGYTDNIGLIIENNDTEFWLTKGMSIAQAVFMPTPHFDFEEVKELENTERGNQGFSS